MSRPRRLVTTTVLGGALTLSLGLAALPASAAEPVWTPLPNGYEQLRYTGPGTSLISLAAWFEGDALVMSTVPGTSSERRRHRVARGQESAVLQAEGPEDQHPRRWTKVASDGSVYTASQVGSGTVIHRRMGTRTTLVTTTVGSAVEPTVAGRFVWWWVQEDFTWRLRGHDTVRNELVAPVGSPVNFSHSTARWTLSQILGQSSSVKWILTDLSSGTARLVAQGTAGQVGPAGLGGVEGVLQVSDGMVVAARHAVHGHELWHVRADGAAPVLLTNVNDQGGTKAITLLGVFGGRTHFLVGGEAWSVSSTPFDERREGWKWSDLNTSTLGRTTASRGLVIHAKPTAFGYDGNGRPRSLGVGMRAVEAARRTSTLTFVEEHDDGTSHLVRTDGSPEGTTRLTTLPRDSYRTGEANTGYQEMLEGPDGSVALKRRHIGNNVYDIVLVRKDRTVRKVAVSAAGAQKQPKSAVKFVVKARAGEKATGRVTGTVKLPGKKAFAFTTKTSALAADRAATLTLTVPKAKRKTVVKAVKKYRAAKASKRAKLTVVATATVRLTDANGNAVSRVVKVRLV